MKEKESKYTTIVFFKKIQNYIISNQQSQYQIRG